MTQMARWCFRRRRLVVLFWIIGLLGLGGISGAVGSSFSDDFTLPDTESKSALDLLTAGAPEQAGEPVTIVVHAKSGTLDDPAIRSTTERMFAEVAALPHVSGVSNFYEPGLPSVSPDRTIGFVRAQLDAQANDVPVSDLKQIITTAKSAESDNVQVELGGQVIAYAERGGEETGNVSELIGLLVAAVVLFLAFGSIFTMFLPILTALLALGTGFALIGFLTHAFPIAAFGPTLAALIGLGVGIDYALFIVSRHRVNLQRGVDPETSVVTAIDTSGRAVLFAGITVCIGILGLMLLGVTFLYGLALSTVVAVLMTMLASLTFLPAMLGFVGLKALSKKQRVALINDGAVDKHEDLSPGWFRWARIVARHPWSLGTAAILVMLILAIPFTSMRLGSTDAGGDPPDSTTRKAYDLLAEGFGPGFNGPLQVVVRLSEPADLAAFGDLVKAIGDTDNVASVTPPVPLPGDKLALAQVYPKSAPQDEATTELIDHLREKVIAPFAGAHGLEVYVGGVTAIFHDFTNVLAEKLPLFIGVVVLLSFLLLMTVFRSLLIPTVASLMNLLSTCASFGVVVAVFQWGWGAGWFGVDQTGPIMAFLPVMAFAILFGLSMDYEVFLVSRMYEEWHRTKNNDEAIALGQAETGRVITAAATIMVVIFASFVFGGEPTIKLFGVSLATAVLLDALLVRTVIVPAVMHLLGPANWYLPKWLDRILPRLNVESPSTAPAQQQPSEAS